MQEIGGYIELDTFRGEMLHEDGIKLNSGRNALDYLLKSNSIRVLHYPKFICNSNDRILRNNNVEIKAYSIGKDFCPVITNRSDDEWIYLVNYYGQISVEYISSFGKNVIVDNAQAYFEKPLDGIAAIYSCRKFFGVADGAILYLNKGYRKLSELNHLEQDKSCKRMRHLLGRYENTASEFYQDYSENESSFCGIPLRKMSRLTENLLRAVDYNHVKERRTYNYIYLHNQFKQLNQLKLSVPQGAFMYPLYIENGAEIRKELQKKGIYIPILWPDVLNKSKKELEYDMAQNILPLPVDQRYGEEEMQMMTDEIKKFLE